MPDVKPRTIIALIGLLCLAASIVLGVIHDHHDGAGLSEEHHCSACQWQVGGVADVPLVFVLAVVGIILALSIPDLSVSLPTIFSLASASRGPPVART